MSCGFGLWMWLGAGKKLGLGLLQRLQAGVLQAGKHLGQALNAPPSAFAQGW